MHLLDSHLPTGPFPPGLVAPAAAPGVAGDLPGHGKLVGADESHRAAAASGGDPEALGGRDPKGLWSGPSGLGSWGERRWRGEGEMGRVMSNSFGRRAVMGREEKRRQDLV